MTTLTRPTRRAPQILDLPPQTMAVVTTTGDPNMVGKEALGALYGAVYTLKFALKKQEREFKVAALRARWPDAPLLPREQWQGIWALPIPDDTTVLVQKVPGVEVTIARWEYGPVAQILHVGPFSAEGPTIDQLHAFIAEAGYEIAGPHEEEYLTAPTARVQKTIIRYVIREK